MTPETILNFWFKELSPEDHFKKSDELDKRITAEFKEIHHKIL